MARRFVERAWVDLVVGVLFDFIVEQRSRGGVVAPSLDHRARTRFIVSVFVAYPILGRLEVTLAPAMPQTAPVDSQRFESESRED